MKERRWHLILPALALLSQVVAPLLLWALAAACYREPRALPEAWERPVSLAALALFAAAGLLLGGAGAYAAMTRCRPGAAVPLIALCCVPALLGGAVYLHALLVFLTVV